MTKLNWVPGAAWLTLCAAVILIGQVLRLSPIEIQVLQPAWLGPIIKPLTLVICGTAALLLWVGSFQARGLMQRRPWAELILFFPLALAYIWLLGPVHQPGTTDYLVMALFLGMAAWLFFTSTGTRPRVRPPWSRQWPWDLLLISTPVLLGKMLGVAPDYQSSGVSLFLYPLYALIQLGVFLVVPAERLRRFGLPRWQTALFCAVVFSLAHAPNPLVMAVTFAVMFLWCWQYLAGRRLWHLAVVMGLCATTFSQFLADDFTGHMRTGPRYLHLRAVEALAQDPAFDAEKELAPSVRLFLERAYPQTVGRAPTEAEIKAWQSSVQEAMPTTLAWIFYSSDEYRRKSEQNNWPVFPPPKAHWSQLNPEWQHRIAAFGSPEYLAKCGDQEFDLLKCLYRDILRRGCSTAELAAWRHGLTVGQRQRLVTLLLDNQFEWNSSPFTGLPVSELLLGM